MLGDTRPEVSRRHACCRQLQLAQRTQCDVYEPEVDHETQAERDAEDRDGIARQRPLPLGDDDDERCRDDEQVGPDQLAEQGHAQRALGQRAQCGMPKRGR